MKPLQNIPLFYRVDDTAPVLLTFGLADSRVCLEAVKCDSIKKKIFARLAVATGQYVRLNSTTIIKTSQIIDRLNVNSDQLNEAIQANHLYSFLSEHAKKVSIEFQSKEWFRYVMHTSCLENNPLYSQYQGT